MKTIALALVILVGCAPLVRYSECETGGLPCPAGTVCQQVTGQHASCTTSCETLCEVSGVCEDGPYLRTDGTQTRFCMLPCDISRECPAGLSCTHTELGLRCL